ncbi:elongation factor 4 [Candidatus Poribacteria bacterium]|jgi:GTP-binding protein LepA|nr:elongation factor 4 [Candidatus Poribacteria bacterium]MBT5713147.1 elongation factor 4 [Candidatus Poribacteria bacterium]MBT7097910.1 elongation factor 4 [Candidatus Poribacteria bacterium]MBT7805563.1 elongation factor 4 [Candidatus Poribacteria bacterium]
MKNTRNFSIIAHIDHGKSTLADRLLEMTGTLDKRQMRDQVLDGMDLERERGITIKATVVRLEHTAADGETYELNLIDTPGHVDFTYEVSRSLAACEGAVLVVDAVQGVEAQTVANVLLAMEQDLEIVPVINKVDLPGARVEIVSEEIENLLGIPAEDILLASAKNGLGVAEVLEAIIERVPPPGGSLDRPLKALVVDSFYESYRGVVMYTRVVDGTLRKGEPLLLMAAGKVYEAAELGVFEPHMTPVDELQAGSVGYVVGNIKDINDTQVGDTLTDPERPTDDPFPGYRELQPLVFCGLFPAETSEYAVLREALERLRLNENSFTFEPETSDALGFGFRCGFLGLLHMDVIRERLEREYGLTLITTAPSVRYRVTTSDGVQLEIENPSAMPDVAEIEEVAEPFVSVNLGTPTEYIGPIMELCESKRGEYRSIEYITPTRAIVHYTLPLSEIVVDFFDRLKSMTRGYGSMDYEVGGYRPSSLVKLDILLNGQPVDALSLIVHKERAAVRGRVLVDKLRAIIPRQFFDVPIQAAIGQRIVARETIKALRKNVTAKCYGGDITRKRKLLERQKEGRRRMKSVGNVEVPQEAFLVVLSTDE